jgi:hypothetical protein
MTYAVNTTEWTLRFGNEPKAQVHPASWAWHTWHSSDTNAGGRVVSHWGFRWRKLRFDAWTVQ